MSTSRERSEIAVLQTQMKDVINRLDRIDAKLDTQINNYTPRNEYITAHQALVDKIDTLTVRIAAMEGKGKAFNSSWGYLMGFILAFAAVAALVLNTVRLLKAGP